MRAGQFHKSKISAPRAQRGVVLLITLIILVAMTLAGIGMMRSVDTGSIVAGNMAFRQATASAGDAGPNAGFTALMDVANSGNNADKAILNFNHGQPCPPGATAILCPGGNINMPGYSSTPILACEVTQTCLASANSSLWWTVNANWNSAPNFNVTDPADPTKIIATISYLIHRMCQTPGVGTSAAGQLCLTYTQPTTGCSLTQVLPCVSTSVFYRVTTRSQGTRDSVSYAQTLVLIAE